MPLTCFLIWSIKLCLLFLQNKIIQNRLSFDFKSEEMVAGDSKYQLVLYFCYMQILNLLTKAKDVYDECR